MLVLGLAVSGACATKTSPPAFDESMTAEVALARLASSAGPLRFAQVAENLFRGGQPTAEHLRLLKAAGVDTIVDLRRESQRAIDAEAATASALGLRFVSVPFYGYSKPDASLLRELVRTMTSGRVYVHCHLGRDRTSLAVALYRVWVDGWDPALAWEREARAFGFYTPTHYRLRDAFFAATSAP